MSNQPFRNRPYRDGVLRTKRQSRFYAVRNIARSNALRFGWKGITDELLLIRRNEAFHAVLEIGDLFESLGFETEFAEPSECLSLSVSKALLHPKTQVRTVEALQSMYDRLHRKLSNRKENKSIKETTPPKVRANYPKVYPTTTTSLFTGTSSDFTIKVMKILLIGLFVLFTGFVILVANIADQLAGVVAFTYRYLAFCILTGGLMGACWFGCFKRHAALFGLVVFCALAASFFKPPPSERLLRSAMLRASPGTRADEIEKIVKEEYERSGFALPAISRGSSGGYDRVHVSLLTQKAKHCTAAIFLIKDDRVERTIFSGD